MKISFQNDDFTNILQPKTYKHTTKKSQLSHFFCSVTMKVNYEFRTTYYILDTTYYIDFPQ